MKTKALISFAVTVKLICVFVFANAKSRFSHNEAHLVPHNTVDTVSFLIYRKVPKYLDARKLCCILSKFQTKRQDLRVFCQKDTNGVANSEDTDQTAPLGAV